MRRAERLVSDKGIIKKFLDSCIYGVLSMVDERKMPYSVPICYGYVWDDKSKFPTFFMHSAKEGKKVDIIKHNPHTCFTIPNQKQLLYKEGEPPCTASIDFESVFAEGNTEIVTNGEEIEKALRTLIGHLHIPQGKFSKRALDATNVFKFVPSSMTMKKFK